MDLNITITDENGCILKKLNAYADGSDSKASENIHEAIVGLYGDDVTELDCSTSVAWIDVGNKP